MKSKASKSTTRTSTKTSTKTVAATRGAFLNERTAFKSLLLANPNYFGNLEKSPFKPVLPIKGNTHYESLGCLGYHPQHKHLEAVVYIHQPAGYGTGICGPGSPEYVRFYLSYDNGASWEDQGLTSFQAHNVPEGTSGSNRLEYAAQLKVDPKRKLCVFAPLIRARAILSWNNPPPANQPHWSPVWGNVRDANILVEPQRFWFPKDLFEVAKVKFPPQLAELLSPDQPIATTPKALSAMQLATLYRGQDVPVHRFAFKELAAFTQSKLELGAESFSALLPGLKFDPKIVDLLYPKTDGDTRYEELKCIGLDPNAPDTLVGVIQVKKASGYSGGPCTDGSREYVTFWADFDGNGSFETCLGTADVRVYDVSASPQQDVYYAVRLPVNLNKYRRPCKDGPRLVRVRAILSWNAPVPCSNPNYVPAWGNREETQINIAPAAQAPAGKIAILGGIPVSMIDNGSGLTTPDAVFATNNLPPDPFGRACPFARRVTAQGAPLLGHSYKVEVIPAGGGAPTAVVNKLVLTRQNGTTHEHLADPATGRFDYVDFTQNVNSVLAQWDSTGDDKWQVRLTSYAGAASNPAAPTVGSPDTHLVQLDNTGPEASIEITAGTGDCGKFKIGDMLLGRFVARDDHLRSYSLGVEPAVNPAGVGVPSPSSGLSNTALAPGDNWSLDTTGMKPCGYVIRVVAVDRAIVNSQSVGQKASHSAGFCLEK
ncbi:hypothetical protein [Marilutibacter alkalisoli]|uniref:GEVED domain-containing protein n=1 Tax=Marilutibacter alkalisoli TaxID=2591633 RepID=A0A514BN36_9GAMM|nr:hypothetical protein [Lysobacter alkalisoli]QDH68796.1 hypothetical protein FKV23_00710 [Lysobacter alkalisoli]